MKRLLTTASLTALLGAAPLALADLETDEERLGYSLGVTLGQSIQQDVDNLNVDAFTQAIRDVFAGDELEMSDEEMAQALMRFQQEATAAREAETEQQSASNREAGEAYLAENAERDDVETTESGLQYRELEAGDGASPQADSSVEVHYEGTLIDGTVFDSSFDRGEPVSFRVDQVIEGWQEALQMMNVGDTWEIVIPSELAYGDQGQGPIGPHETLVFKVELLGVDDN
ncbi:FKBP-type peptidyl-prolyl cis-trans isomerase [Halomonas sp. TRM85114]|uniref:FKBP-type peptidyl-prolyl cis-trans isomerase n=1 Tax=Halomonas jincaotanensis TaxID=2810616 RepID=UPI001BD1E48D|nr:FKBP-type peptidyl-prolyl cis-trans isomerase [Halomonas jincaotanensis]MBS9404647.1 FKBP-type peptidyl-prolyl cis-trans isomerase [Halomonas jincaotanensis]